MSKEKIFGKSSFGKYRQTDVFETLRASGGDLGGYGDIGTHILYSDTVGALCARDYKGVGSQYVYEGKLVIEVVRTETG